jgi:hypothetical protein
MSSDAVTRCDDRFFLADEFFHCELPEGHDGDHSQSGEVAGQRWELRWEPTA